MQFLAFATLFFETDNVNCIEGTVQLGDVAAFENRQPVTAAEFITKSSLFILLLGFIRRLELKPNSEQKVENIFVSPPYCHSLLCAFQSL